MVRGCSYGGASVGKGIFRVGGKASYPNFGNRMPEHCLYVTWFLDQLSRTMVS